MEAYIYVHFLFLNTHSKKVFSECGNNSVYKPCSPGVAAELRGVLERGEMPQQPAGDRSPRAVTCQPHRPTVPGEGPLQPPALLLSTPVLKYTELAQAQTPTSASAPGRKSVFTGKAPLSSWAEFSENTDKLSPSLKFTRPPLTAWTQLSH